MEVRVCDIVQSSILGFVKALSGIHNRDGAVEADDDLTKSLYATYLIYVCHSENKYNAREMHVAIRTSTLLALLAYAQRRYIPAKGKYLIYYLSHFIYGRTKRKPNPTSVASVGMSKLWFIEKRLSRKLRMS